MRTVVAIGGIALLLTGCSGAAPPAKNTAAQGAGAFVPQQPFSTPTPAPPQQVVQYQGQTPAQWGERLLGPDSKRRQEASQALSQLKENGTPYLIKGLYSASSDTRRLSIEALPVSEMVRHEKETMPALVQMLQDKSAGVRQQAVGRLAWFGKNARNVVPTLQRLAESDPNADVRDAARASITDIQEAISGKRRPDG